MESRPHFACRDSNKKKPKGLFDLVYYDHAAMRVCFFINVKLRGLWSYTHHSPDFGSLRLQCQDRTIHIHNIYNPSPGPGNRLKTLALLDKVLQQHKIGEEHIALGYFNLHYPHWGGHSLRNTHAKADSLLAITKKHQMQLLFPPGTITRQEKGQSTTIDLIFVTHTLLEGVITCGLVDRSLDRDLGRLVISTTLELATATRHPTPRRI